MKPVATQILSLSLAILLSGCATSPPQPLVTGEAAREQVAATERAFAKSMADRDFKAFGALVSNDTVFFSGPKPLHGKQAVLNFWERFFKDPKPPFSWEPVLVEVLESGTLARSSGPVHDPQGKLAGCFNSIWRQEAPARWRIVFDHGMGPQECEKK